MRTNFKLVILIFLGLSIMNTGFCGSSEIFYSDITVGTRTGDLTGQITISASNIQQSIISTIPALSGMNLQSSQASLIVTSATAYLIISGTTSSGESVKLAIELITDNSNLMYSNNKGAIHICKNAGGCSACEFVKIDNRIVNCRCSPSATSNNPLLTSCNNSTIWVK